MHLRTCNYIDYNKFLTATQKNEVAVRRQVFSQKPIIHLRLRSIGYGFALVQRLTLINPPRTILFPHLKKCIWHNYA